MLESRVDRINVDPFTREIVRSKLFGVVDEAFIALENVAGTMLVSEAHDAVVALYTPRGELLYSGTGVLNHPSCAARAVRGIIKEMSEDPGIREDDIFMMNDPSGGALHAPDVFIIQPIHHAEELVAFVACFVHVTDIGSIDPGGFCPNATEVFHEGFQTLGLKIAEGGKIRQDVWNTLLNMSRTPDALAMDLKSMISAGYVGKQRMKNLIEEYGAEVILWVGDDLIDESARLFRERLLEIPDGTFRSRRYVDLEDDILRIQIAAIKEQDTLTLDFTGTSDQTSSALNVYEGGTQGASFPPILTLLCWDIVWNEGLIRNVNIRAPEGSLVNCLRPAATSISSIGVATLLNQLSTEVISKMLIASEKYRSRGTGNWLGVYTCEAISGLLPNGDFTVGLGTNAFGGAGGGRSGADGIDVGGDLTSITGAIANAETVEYRLPVLDIFRKIVPDSGGPGQYRGGCSYEFAQVSHGSPDRKFSFLAIPGIGIHCPPAIGISGGLPGSTVVCRQYRTSNALMLPRETGEIEAETIENLGFGSTEIREKDILYIRHSGGGGYGDPLKREPELVLADVEGGLVSRRAASDIYGVILDGDDRLSLNLDETNQRRLELRRRRLDGPLKSTPTPSVRRSGWRINEYLQEAKSGSSRVVQCLECGHSICPANEPWKDHAVLQMVAAKDAGYGREDSPPFYLMMFYCPGCATQLEVQVNFKGDSPTHDEIRSWPESR